MKRGIRNLAAAAAGLLSAALGAHSQNYTISAKPGVVNYIEGLTYLNGAKLSEQAVRATFLTAGDEFSTGAGKAEILLSPGVFLRIGDESEIRMIAPSLVNTQLAVVRGEAIIEAVGLVKGNTIAVTDHGGSITIERNGLYRFKADDPPAVAVLQGKALVYLGEKKVDLDKNHEVILAANLQAKKFDPKQEDDLYAWSNVRSEYEAAASYQAAQSVASSSGANTWSVASGYGAYDPGWFWNSAFGSYAWLPGYGAFYSPFGYGFYAPGAVGYAPVVTTTVYRGGTWNSTNHPGWTHHHWSGSSITASVPINTKNPPAVGVIASSPFAAQQARVQAAHSLAETGTFNPRVAAGSNSFVAGSHVSTSGPVGVRGGGGWVGGASGGHAESNGGGGRWAGGGGGAHASPGFSGGGVGGGHASNGGGGGGGAGVPHK